MSATPHPSPSANPGKNPGPNQWELRLRRLVDSALGAALGGLFYASWAVAVNWDSGPQRAFEIGAVHWCMSAFLTYTGTAVMRWFYSLGGQPPYSALLACCGGLGFTYSLLISVHSAIGTPHIALTLAAGVIPTFAFCCSYAVMLARTSPVLNQESQA